MSDNGIQALIHQLAGKAAPIAELEAELTFQDAVRIARGCNDYGGGHHTDGHMDAYKHGINTVVRALEEAEVRGLTDTQVAALHSIGAERSAP